MVYRLQEVSDIIKGEDITVKQYVMEEREIWVPARPIVAPFICRLKDAWLVLIGSADAFKWPMGQ